MPGDAVPGAHLSPLRSAAGGEDKRSSPPSARTGADPSHRLLGFVTGRQRWSPESLAGPTDHRGAFVLARLWDFGGAKS